MTDCVIVMPFIERYVPKVYNHLCKLNCLMCLSNLLYKWFISLFSENMSTNIWLPIWDLMILHGNIILIKAAIIIILLDQDNILKQKDMGEISMYFEEGISSFNNPNFLDYLIKKKFLLKTDVLNRLREIHISKIKEKVKNNSSINDQNNLEDKECNVEWPLCINSFSNEDSKPVFIIKQLFPPQIINNFFSITSNPEELILDYNNRINYNYNKIKKDEQKLKHHIFKHLLFYRDNHKCGNEYSGDITLVNGDIQDKSHLVNKSLILFGSMINVRNEVDKIKIISEVGSMIPEDNNQHLLSNGDLFVEGDGRINDDNDNEDNIEEDIITNNK